MAEPPPGSNILFSLLNQPARDWYLSQFKWAPLSNLYTGQSVAAFPRQGRVWPVAMRAPTGHLLNLRIDNQVMVPPDPGGYTPINPDPLMSWVGENGEIWGRWLRRGPAMIYGGGKLLQPRFLLFTLLLQPAGHPPLLITSSSSTSSSRLRTNLLFL